MNSRVLTYGAALLALVASYVAMGPSLDNGFTNWDDQYYVWNNPTITSLDAEHRDLLWNERVLGHYHPFTMFSYAFDYAAAQLDPARYHTTNLFLHLFNVLLVFILILRISERRDVALIAAIFFGIHPVHVEAVAWISARKDLLFSAFYLGAFIVYERYTATGKRWILYAVLPLFIASLMSKAMAVSLPVLLLAYDLLITGTITRKDIIEKVPMFVVAFIFGYITFTAQQEVGAVQDSSSFSFLDRIFIASRNLLWYGYQAIYPHGLSCLYPYPAAGDLPLFYMISPILILGIGFALWRLREYRELLFGMLFFIVPLALLLQLIPVGDALTADRYSYLPYIGIGYLIGVAFVRVGKPYMYPAIGILAAAGIFYVTEARAQCAVWKDSGTLWTNVIDKHPNVSKAYNNRSKIFIEQGNFELALQDFSKAIALDRSNSDAYNNRGNVHRQLKMFPEAIDDFSMAIQLRPDNPSAYSNRSWTWFELKDYQKALDDALVAESQGKKMKEDYIPWLKQTLGVQ